ncbi:MAG: PqqD family protein [Paludibacteraceae bacterium]|jgi:hypothetical protein|nr:PqqD family protein [Paludibacteraceae bacterium]MDI9537528.1 PqqD family protein [Bacteroidota bacterium]OQC34359.1 MAG: Coenzyme PQQ synthesis protein D [Bacteroidetes bacterium ADurb.Bin057]HHT61390.1 PqqD family protein [Bacteroidales bacterium]MBP9039246.1 PqqD family protein [Paludibacteraceae bacterium]
MRVRKNIAISENGFIFNPLTGDSFSVNETGVFIVQKLKDGESDETIIQNLKDKYDLDTSTAEKDFNDFLSMLQSYQLIAND